MMQQESATRCFKWAEINYENGEPDLALFLFRKGVSHRMLAGDTMEEVQNFILPLMSEEAINSLIRLNDKIETKAVEYTKWADKVSCLFHM